VKAAANGGAFARIDAARDVINCRHVAGEQMLEGELS
jgi:hypothetical protein